VEVAKCTTVICLAWFRIFNHAGLHIPASVSGSIRGIGGPGEPAPLTFRFTFLSKLSKPQVGVFTDVGRFLTFCEEPPVVVLKNKSELFQFAEIKRNLKCDSRFFFNKWSTGFFTIVPV
jgi:hypothetical protein